VKIDCIEYRPGE
jgi:hypothetical protein